MATERIVAGVGAKNAQPRVGKGTKGPKSLGELTKIAAKSHFALNRFLEIVALRENEIAKRAAEIRADWDRHTDLDRSVRASMAEKEISAYRKNILASTASERDALLKELAEYESEVNAVAGLYESPVMMLSRAGLGGEQRSRYQNQLAHSGPAEVKAMAEYAIATSDKALGAAILSKLDSMSARNRELTNLNRQDVAEALVGEDFAKAREAVAISCNRMAEARNRDRALVAGRVHSAGGFDRITLALEKAGESGILDQEEGEEE